MGYAARHHPSDPTLWSRIRGAHLPVECDGREFHQHLCDITGLGAARGRALELEYRRFLYLAARSETWREPSALVRLAWEYHVGLEAGYAEDFCPWVLGRTLRPRPAPEAPRPAYGATCADYRAEFGIAPPEAIWPDPELAVPGPEIRARAAPAHVA